METRFFFPPGQHVGPPETAGGLPFAKQTPIAGPAIVFHPGQSIQRIFGDIGQCVPEIPVGIQIDGNGRSMPENFPLSILFAEVLRIHPEPFHFESVRIILAGGKDGGVAVVGHCYIYDYYHILTSSADENVLDHHIIILIVTTED
jgi:hypothetical protein